MRVPVRSSAISCFLGAAAALWLCSAGTARAEGGGEDLAALNSTILGLCPILGIPTTSCPQLPTITQAFLELAALVNAPPEAVRGDTGIPLGLDVDAGNPSRPRGLNPISAFPVEGTSLTNLLPTLTPLAFISAPNVAEPAKPTQLYDPDADTFLYAVANGVGAQPDKLVLLYEDLSRTSGTFLQGQIVAKISLPLVILNSNQPAKPESPVVTTLQISAACAGGPACLRADAVGGIGNPHNPIPATSLGIGFDLVFSPSPISAHPHAIFEFQVPLVVTRAIDRPYFPNSISFIRSPFLSDETGFTPTTPGILPAGASVGFAPSAQPWQLPPAGGPAIYALCASLPRNGNRHAPVPAVAAFYAIAADGETLLAAPLVPPAPIVCPF
jgi:hypothetical protein